MIAGEQASYKRDRSAGDRVSRPISQNTLEQRRDESRRRIHARKIPHVYMLSLK